MRATAVEQWLGRGLKAQADQCLREPLPDQWLEMIDRSVSLPGQAERRRRF